MSDITKLDDGEGVTWTSQAQDEVWSLKNSLHILTDPTSSAITEKYHAESVRALFKRVIERNAALRARVLSSEPLVRFLERATHGADCEQVTMPNGYGARCTCGLSDAREAAAWLRLELRAAALASAAVADCPRCEHGWIEHIVAGSASKTEISSCDCPAGRAARESRDDALEARGEERSR